MSYLTVSPAYGRDYKSVKTAKEDWQSDKDFIETTTGRYINRRQVVESDTLIDGFQNTLTKPIEVMVRYKSMTMIGKLETVK